MTRLSTFTTGLLALGTSALALAACEQTTAPTVETEAAARRRPSPALCADRNPTKNAYFGDLHVHTSYSFDAYIGETRNDPNDAYRFAKGEALQIAPIDASGYGTRTAQLDRPLDFAATTDHGEYLGEVQMCTEPGHRAYRSATCRNYRNRTVTAFAAWGVRLVEPNLGRFRFCGTNDAQCMPATVGVWQDVQAAAHNANDPCDFTTFVSYEWTGSGSEEGPGNLHRNVIFANRSVPDRPTTYFEQTTADGLWDELQTQCIDAGTGCDVLAIPHNSNISKGQMFRAENANGSAMSRWDAERRARMEPLAEITQVKGESECNMLLFPDDEGCGFEKLDESEPNRSSFVRSALGDGLLTEEAIGANPFQLGFIGSTDTHNATPGDADEYDYIGSHGIEDDTPAKRVALNIDTNPGGLAVVWAAENTRSALFSAMRSRETYATSGTRIILRLFGVWGEPANRSFAPGWETGAYAAGVPMGSTMRQRPDGAVPHLIVAADWDSGTAQNPGTRLQKIQIIKGWVDGDGELQEAVFDVATGAEGSVDLQSCEVSGHGARQLATVWRDPTFVEGQRAYYYARILENPSCRWSTRLCNDLGVDCSRKVPRAYRNCCDPELPKTIQERAWSSPIWYSPEVGS